MLNKAISNKIKKKYNSTAKQWDKVWTKSEEINNKIIKFINQNTSDTKFLSAGIGKGDLESNLVYTEIYGVDISRSMIDICKERNPRFKLYVGNVEHLRYKDNSFDIVFARNLLRNFVNPSKAFKEMYRVLKKNGKLIIIETAVYKGEEKYMTYIIRIADPFRPVSPTHEGLKKLFVNNKLHNISQKVVRYNDKWLTKWCISKDVGEDKKQEVINYVLHKISKEYIKKYKIKVYLKEREIKQDLTFSFIKGTK